jgi:hypothetical protein
MYAVRYGTGSFEVDNALSILDLERYEIFVRAFSYILILFC